MVLLMFFQAVYFGHFLLFSTMQLEPPKSWPGVLRCSRAPLTVGRAVLVRRPPHGGACGVAACPLRWLCLVWWCLAWVVVIGFELVVF